MYQPKKLYKVLRGGCFVTTLIPGRYAGNQTHKIFGRLDCKPGMRVDRDNRVFFASWKDATAAGYIPCKNCKPHQLDMYPEQEALKEELQKHLHIAIFKTWSRPIDHTRPDKVWSVCLVWQDRHDKQGQYRKVVFKETYDYNRARHFADQTAKECNLMVLQHNNTVDLRIVSMPVERANDLEVAKDKQAIKKLLGSKKIDLHYWML